MAESEITLKSAGPAGATRLGVQVRATTAYLSVHWPKFMLPNPLPAADLADIRAARAALTESDQRTPYDQIRQELDLE
jgi:mono/diheme cytochrome c family protein